MLENREKPHGILAKPFIKSNIDNFVHSVGYNNAPFIIRIVNESEHLKSMQFYLSVQINRSLRYVYPVLKQYSGKTNMNTDTCSEIRQ